jgi:pseudouridine kinase
LVIAAEAPVLVIGAAGVDVVGRVDAELHAGSSTPAEIRFSFGGVGRNVAENLARLGQPVKLLSAVGSSYFGKQLLQQLQDAGVNTDLCLTTQHPTGSYIAVLHEGEVRLALDDMRALQALTPGYLRDHYADFKEAALLFIDSNLPRPVLKTAVSLARRAKTPIVADPTSSILAPKLIPYLPYLKLITPNRAEAAVFCEQPLTNVDSELAIEYAKNLVSRGVEIVIITMSEFGVCYATPETSGSISAIRTEIVDPIGAGDALTATVIFALLNKIPLDDAIRLGVSAASLTLRHRGAVLPELTLQKLYDTLLM